MNESAEKICPSAGELSRESCRNVMCPIAGCQKILPQLSALRFHKIKAHGIIENETDRRILRREKSADHSRLTYQFHCPSPHCIYGPNQSKHFATYKLLKQHYMKVHAPKFHVCLACRASFGLSYDLARHLKNCRLANIGIHKPAERCIDVSSAASNDGQQRPASSVLRDGEVLMEDIGIRSSVSRDDGSLAVEDSAPVSSLMEPANPSDASGDCSTTHRVSLGTQPVVKIVPTQETASNITAAVVEDTTTKLARLTSQDQKSSGVQKTGGKRKVHKSNRSHAPPAEPCCLLPKPNAILLPVLLPVVVLADTRHACAVDTRPHLIAPKRSEADSQVKQNMPPSLLAGHSVSSKFSTSVGSSCIAVQSEPAPSVRTQSTQSVSGLRRKAAETQTLPSAVLLSGASGFVMKESTASQVIPRPSMRSYRAIRHSHTQTHGTHRRLQRDTTTHTDVSVPIDCASDHNMSSFACIWPDTATNATQTVDSSFPGVFYNDSVTDEVLFSSGSWLPDSSQFSSVVRIPNVSGEKCSNSGSSSLDFASNNGGSGNQVIGADVAVSDGSSARSVSGDLTGCHENELFHSTRDVSVQFDQLLDEWAASASVTAGDSGSGTEHASASSLSRLMLTSASQTVAIDFDAAATQTMECDFDAVDFDFANTETQTTSDLLDAYFGFTDIETQTVQDLQLWDSQTQTCFDSLI